MKKALDAGSRIRFRSEQGDLRPAQVITTAGADPAKPLGVLVTNEDGTEEVQWIAAEQRDEEFFLGVYYAPRVGLFTKVYATEEDISARYGEELIVEIRRYVLVDGAWESSVPTRPAV